MVGTFVLPFQLIILLKFISYLKLLLKLRYQSIVYAYLGDKLDFLFFAVKEVLVEHWPNYGLDNQNF